MPPEWLQYGSFGVLVLALVWGAKYAIPKALSLHEDVVTRIAEQNKAAVDKLTGDQKETITALVGDFRAELREQRATHEREIGEQRAYHERELGKRDEAIGKIAEAVDRIGERMKPVALYSDHAPTVAGNPL